MRSLTLFLWFFLMAQPALAHFGMLIPGKAVVEQPAKAVDLTLSFSHPMEAVGMDMAKPAACFVSFEGERQDLLPGLAETKVLGKKAWKTSVPLAKPGVYQFVMEPTPYWEPAEDLSIIHYTKVVVAAFGEEEGWQAPVGLKTEIVPMTRPFGAYAGFVFTGKVLVDGQPVPNAMVEVEYYNETGKLKPASAYHVTHAVVTDERGVFSFACPKAGWWGFAALTEGKETLPDTTGAQKPVELGAVLWVKMDPLP